MKLRLPFPPSVNTYWRHVMVNGAPRVLLSKRGRAYAAQAARCKLEQAQGDYYPLGTPLRVTVALYAPDKRARDLDNALKATLDALQKAGCFESDAQIDDLRIVRAGVDKPLGHLEVEVQPLHATP